MPFRDSLNHLLDKAEAKYQQFSKPQGQGQSYQQQPQYSYQGGNQPAQGQYYGGAPGNSQQGNYYPGQQYHQQAGQSQYYPPQQQGGAQQQQGQQNQYPQQSYSYPQQTSWPQPNYQQPPQYGQNYQNQQQYPPPSQPSDQQYPPPSGAPAGYDRPPAVPPHPHAGAPGSPPPNANYYGAPPSDTTQAPPVPSGKPFQQASSPPPPPISYANKPGGLGPNPGMPNQSSQDEVYWRAVPASASSVGELFEYRTGQNGWGNNELQNYTNLPSNSFIADDGKLVVRAIVNKHAGLPREQAFTSARLVSKATLGRQGGYLHARLTTPCAKGIWPAFWLLPKEPFSWPGDGEIDIFEDWNNTRTNHSCLHWGTYNGGEDANKHRVQETPIPSADDPAGRSYGLAWALDPTGRQGRIAWYVDGQVVMRCTLPGGMRPLQEFTVLLNIAMGGNVCGGIEPENGTYDMVVHELLMASTPPGGWGKFDWEWNNTRDGPGAPR